MTNKKTTNFKVVLLGEGCVGKTSIVLQYVENRFNTQHVSTLQASFLAKKLTLDDGRKVQLNIWDTAGQERFHALGPIYYRGSHGAILVYDITDQDSFLKVKIWVKELQRMLGADIVIAIAGNKTDLEEQRTVMRDDAIQYTESVGAHYFETSAKTNEGIDDLFRCLTLEMVETLTMRDPETASVMLMLGAENARRLMLSTESSEDDEDENVPRRNLGCCGAG